MTKPLRRAVNGVLLLDKPYGLSSNAALQRAKRLFNARKAGHTGSLDPMASGLLPLCFGEATKISQYLINADKCYRASMQLGITTVTGDREGEVIARRDSSGIGETEVAAAMAAFRGTLWQLPPMYSALKYQGQPLYKLALKGQEVERRPRELRIYRLELTGFRDTIVDFDVHCSKGTYIRTLAQDMGERLGCGAHLVALRRYAVGGFAEQAMVSLEQLEAQCQAEGVESLDRHLLPLDGCLGDWPRVTVDERERARLCSGQAISFPDAGFNGRVRLYGPGQECFGLGEVDADGRLRPRRIFHFSA